MHENVNENSLNVTVIQTAIEEIVDLPTKKRKILEKFCFYLVMILSISHVICVTNDINRKNFYRDI